MRRLGLMGLLCLFVMAGLSSITTSAQAFTLICSGKTTAQVAACDTSGYAKVMSKMHWRMYGGHNCTNYAAYRMQKAGVPEPRILMGNARDWATNAKKLGYLVDQRPAVGAIAQWSKAASHVAYVEEVGQDYLILSEDSYTSKVYRRYKVKSTDSWYPERFIHFKDVSTSVAPQKPTVESTVTVSAPAKVSSSIKATVTVKVATGDGAPPVGTLRVRRGGVTVATTSLTATAKGTAKVTIPKMKRGTQWISAVFDGNATVRAATSGSARVVVTKPPKTIASTTTVTPAVSTFAAGARTKVAVAVKATDGRVMTNAVSVYVDGVRVASPVLKKTHKGKVTVTLPALTAGRHTITATYWGCPTVKRSKASAKAVVVVEPTVTSGVLAKATVISAEKTAVTATVTTPRGVAPTAGEVWALVDGVKVASANLTAASKGVVTIGLPVLAPGNRQVAVQYRGSTYQTASAAPASTLVVQQPTRVSSTLSAASIKTTTRATVSVTVRTSTGVAATSGTVTVLEGSKKLATATLGATGTVRLTLPTFAAGTHKLTVTYGGNATLEPSTAALPTLTVKK